MQARLLSPDPLLDELEENWWNQNAETIEAIWAQPELVRQGVRQHYIKRAKKFFLYLRCLINTRQMSL